MTVRADGHEMRFRPEHEATDPHETRAFERLLKEGIGLARTAPRAQVVGLLEEHGVDVVEVDEVFEFDRRAALRADLLDLLRLQHREPSGFDLVSPEEITVCKVRLGPSFAVIVVRRLRPIGIDRFVRRRLRGRDVIDRSAVACSRRWVWVFGNAAVSHPSALTIEEMESHVLRLGGRVESDRDRHQSEGKRTGPHRSWHAPRLPRSVQANRPRARAKASSSRRRLAVTRMSD